MNELIKIENQQGTLVVSSRTIAEQLNKRHSDVISQIEKLLTNENVRSLIISSEYKDKKGEKRKEYLLTKDGFTLYMFNIQGYNDFKIAYIDRFNKMEKALQQQFKVPTSFKEALQLALEQQEQIEQQQKALEEAKPKVLFAEAVASSKSTILIGELAKLLKQNGIEIGQNKLFAWLRDNGYLIRRQGSDYNMPSQYSMNLGLFEIKETSITHADGHITVNRTPKVTGKGQQYFINKFLGVK